MLQTACRGCSFCSADVPAAASGEAHKRCSFFKALKADVSDKSYIETALRDNDANGFAAAGVIPVRRAADGSLELLLCREFRDETEGRGGDLLNFLGGRRRKLAVQASAVAVEKFDAETGSCLRRSTLTRMRSDTGMPLVLWSATSKYALFLHELTGSDVDIDVSAAGVRGAKRLEWIRSEQLLNDRFLRAEVHFFAGQMVRDIRSYGVLQRLAALFDCAARDAAAAAAAAGGSAAAGTGAAAVGGAGAAPGSAEAAAEEEATAAFDRSRFDVVAALREAAVAARPSSRTLPETPTWSQLVVAASLCSAADKRKLRLRFHPDKVARNLGREPTEEEHKIATVAMTLLNLACEDSAASVSTSVGGEAAMKELSDYLHPPPPAAAGGAAGGAAAADDHVDVDLAEMLRRVKLDAAAGGHRGAHRDGGGGHAGGRGGGGGPGGWRGRGGSRGGFYC